jgi:hypothetical protein
MDLIIVTILIVAAVSCVFVFIRKRETEESPEVPMRAIQKLSSSERLAAMLQQRPDYVLYVGMPLDRPREWRRASYANTVIEVDGASLDVRAVKSFAITYPNRQVVDFVPGMLLALRPEGVSWLEPPSGRAEYRRIALSDLSPSDERVSVQFGPCTAHPNDGSHYSTTLTNLTTRSIRITGFGGYKREGGDFYCLNNVTGRLYSTDDFSNWYYGATADGCIEPGQSATDFNNYGGPGALWAYDCTMDTGETFTAGRVYSG